MGMATEPHQFRVLAVDDNLIDRKLIKRLLKTSSYQVDSGSKALEFLGLYEDETSSPPNSLPATLNNHQEVNVDHIITDYCMPGMTGYDLLKKINVHCGLYSIRPYVTSKTNKTAVRNRACKWSDPMYETTRLIQDGRTKIYDEKMYKLVLAMGSSRSSLVGEANI